MIDITIDNMRIQRELGEVVGVNARGKGMVFTHEVIKYQLLHADEGASARINFQFQLFRQLACPKSIQI